MPLLPDLLRWPQLQILLSQLLTLRLHPSQLPLHLREPLHQNESSLLHPQCQPEDQQALNSIPAHRTRLWFSSRLFHSDSIKRIANDFLICWIHSEFICHQLPAANPQHLSQYYTARTGFG